MLLLLSLFIVCESECESKWWKKNKSESSSLFCLYELLLRLLEEFPITIQTLHVTQRNATPQHNSEQTAGSIDLHGTK